MGRADATATGTTLFASREVAGPHGLSGSWVADHAIHAVKGQSLSGAFTLRAINAPGLTAAADGAGIRGRTACPGYECLDGQEKHFRRQTLRGRTRPGLEALQSPPNR